jgi:anaerobic magnesium-protoporphyrin IX monomethyl ester cyclase
LDVTEMAFNIFDPMPGSDEYVKCQQMGLVPEDPDWSGFPFWPDAHYVRDISPEEFSRRANEIAEWLYLRNSRLRYKLRRNRQYIQSLIFSDPVHLAGKIWRFLLRRWKVRRIRNGIREGRP